MRNHRIKELREQKSWSQDHLAEATGLSLRTIQRAEAGEKLSKETLLNIAAALNVSVEEFNQSNIRSRFLIFILILSLTFFLTFIISWLLYGENLDTQNQFFLNYKIFLMLTSFATGIAWGIGNAWFTHQHKHFVKDFVQFVIGAMVIFAVYNFLPFIKYPNDQYSAAFPWLVTGLIPMGIAWACLMWFQDDLKKIFTHIHFTFS